MLKASKRAVVASILTVSLLVNWLLTPRCASSATSTGADRYALLVGINDYDNAPKLAGCLNDVESMRVLLIRKFGFPADHIVTLTDHQATHEAIVGAFQTHLVANARLHPDALVVFMYSGHGSQVPDLSGDKPTGSMDSTLVPVNSRDPEGRHFDIRDEELGALCGDLGCYTSSITLVLDCCHAGSGLRGQARPGIKEIPPDLRPQPREKPILHAEPNRGSAVPQDSHHALPLSERWVVLSACLRSEKAYEMQSGERVSGAFSTNLIYALERARPETTFEEAMAEVARGVTLAFPHQHPQLEGDIRRAVLGGAATREDPFVKLIAVNKDCITFAAGAAQGVRPGALVAVYSSNARRISESDKRLATATVVSASPLESTARLTCEATVPANARVAVVTPTYGLNSLRVAVDLSGSPGSRALASLVATELQSNPLLQAVGLPHGRSPLMSAVGAWDVAILQGQLGDVFPNRLDIATASDQAQVPAPDALVTFLAAQDGKPLSGFFTLSSDPKAARKMVEALEKLARQRNVRALTNESSDLQGAIRLTPLRLKGPDASSGGVPAELRGVEYAFDQGEYFKIRIDNISGEGLYVTLFDLSPDGSIHIVYPPHGASDVLPAHGSVNPNVYRTTGPSGDETFKAVITTARADFSFLEQGAALRTSTAAVSPIEALLEQAFGRNRDLLLVPGNAAAEWDTSEIHFRISDRIHR